MAVKKTNKIAKVNISQKKIVLLKMFKIKAFHNFIFYNYILLTNIVDIKLIYSSSVGGC
jgi:hypothetical protein